MGGGFSASSGIIEGLNLNVEIISENVGWKEYFPAEYGGTT